MMSCLVLKEPVIIQYRGKAEEEGKDEYDYKGEYIVNPGFTLAYVQPVLTFHDSPLLYFSCPALNWTADKIAIMIARITPMALP